MIDTNEIQIRCPKCSKLVCSMDYNANPRGIHFWCPRCKKKFDIEIKGIYRKSSSSQ